MSLILKRFRPSSERIGQLRPLTAGLLITMAMSVTAFIVISRYIDFYAHYPFDSDEATHANHALILALDLKRLDVMAYLRHSYQQSVYPPGAAWIQSLFFLIFGASTVTARLFSLLNYILAGFVLYALALELDDQLGWLIGIVAVFFFFTAQSLLVIAALSMLEMPGLLLTLLTLWTYIRCNKRSRTFVPVSILAALTTLVKYPYGIVVFGTLGLAEMLQLSSTKPWYQGRLGRWAGLFGPAAVLLTLWFVGEQKVADFLYYANLQPKQTNWYSLDNIIFYPQSFSLHYVGGLGIALVAAIAIAYATYKWRRRQVRVLLLYILVGTLILTLKESNNPRFFATIAPPIYLLIGYFVASAFRMALEARRTKQVYVGMAGAGIMVLALILSLPTWFERLAVYPDLLEVEYETDPDTMLLSEWIVKNAGQERLFFINPWDQFSTFAMEWYLATTQRYHENRFSDVFVPDARLAEFSPDRVEELETQIRFYSTRYVVVLEGGLEGKQVWHEYERALSSDLRQVATESFPIEFCNLSGWSKTVSVTRDSLSRAKIENCWTLNILATMYMLLDPAKE